MIVTTEHTLEIQRVVLENEVNSVYICKDKRKIDDLFYTCICIRNEKVQKKVIKMLMKEPGIRQNPDYVEHFIDEDKLNILFLYKEERILRHYIHLYNSSFIERKTLCKNIVAACQTRYLEGEYLALIMHPTCLNIREDGQIYFNYFLDFRQYRRIIISPPMALKILTQKLFTVLVDEYELICKKDVYPKALMVYQKKYEEGFETYGEIYRYLDLLPNQIEERDIIQRIKELYQWLLIRVKKYALLMMLLGMLSMAFWFGFNLITNVHQDKTTQVYKGLYQIGTVEVDREIEEKGGGNK